MKKKRKKKYVIQTHHVVYAVDKKQRDVTTKVRRTEHFYLTQIARINPITKGFIRSLRLFALLNIDRAVNAEDLKEE